MLGTMMRWFSFLMIAFVVAGCDGSPKTTLFFLDNPLQESIEVTLDGKVYVIAPTSSVEVSLAGGLHEVSYQGATARFNVVPGGNGGIINPTLSDYYVYYRAYLSSGFAADYPSVMDSYLRSRQNRVMIRGEVMEGPFRRENGLVIENFGEVSGWILGLDEKYSSTYSRRSNVYIVGKVFREADFFRFLRRYHEIRVGEDDMPNDRHLNGLERLMLPVTFEHECQSVRDYWVGLNDQFDVLQSEQQDVKALEEAREHLKLWQLEFSRAQQACPKPGYLNMDIHGGSEYWDARAVYEDPLLNFGKMMRGAQIDMRHVFVVVPESAREN